MRYSLFLVHLILGKHKRTMEKEISEPIYKISYFRNISFGVGEYTHIRNSHIHSRIMVDCVK